jgi:hypothetical protein
MIPYTVIHTYAIDKIILSAKKISPKFGRADFLLYLYIVLLIQNGFFFQIV